MDINQEINPNKWNNHCVGVVAEGRRRWRQYKQFLAKLTAFGGKKKILSQRRKGAKAQRGAALGGLEKTLLRSVLRKARHCERSDACLPARQAICSNRKTIAKGQSAFSYQLTAIRGKD